MRLIFFCFAALTVFLISIFDLQARELSGRCKNVENSADSMACVKTIYDESQAELNEVFRKNLAVQDEGTLLAFHQAQAEWVSYRDKECSWKAGQLDNESLKRIEGLACLTTLTNQRIEVLEDAYIRRKEDEVREYSALPRWMNVVSRAYPEIFWRYGDYASQDLNCDGQKEEVMVGQIVQGLDVYVKDGQPYVLKTVLAVTENPVSGRPQTHILALEMQAADSGDGYCDPNIKLSPVVIDEKSGRQCAQTLEIKGKRCSPKILFWDGTNFVLEPAAKAP